MYARKYSISLATSLNPYLTFDSTPKAPGIEKWDSSTQVLNLMNDSDPRHCSGFGGFLSEWTP